MGESERYCLLQTSYKHFDRNGRRVRVHKMLPMLEAAQSYACLACLPGSQLHTEIEGMASVVRRSDKFPWRLLTRNSVFCLLPRLQDYGVLRKGDAICVCNADETANDELATLRNQDLSRLTWQETVDCCLPAAKKAYTDYGHLAKKCLADAFIVGSIPLASHLDGEAAEQPAAQSSAYCDSSRVLEELWGSNCPPMLATLCQSAADTTQSNGSASLDSIQQLCISCSQAAQLVRRSQVQFLHKLVNCIWHKRQDIAQQVSCI